MIDPALRVAFVIPALNEQATIFAVVSALQSYGLVIVVDDGSHDATAALAAEAGALVISKPSREGYDRALTSGFRKVVADGLSDWVVTLDADGQHSATSVFNVLEVIAKDGADLVLGVRPNFPRLSERLMALFYGWKWGIPDPLCGLKAYRASFLRRVDFDGLWGRDTIGTGVMLGLLAQNARVAALPVQILARRDRPRFGSLITANYKILKLLAQTPLIWKAMKTK